MPPRKNTVAKPAVKAVAKVAEPKIEPKAEIVVDIKPEKPVENYADFSYVCITKCFFEAQIWDEGDETGYIDGIEKSPYFEKCDGED